MVKELDSLGSTIATTHFKIFSDDAEDFQLIMKEYGCNDPEVVRIAIKQAFAQEFIKRAYMGEGSPVQLTRKGEQAARSRLASMAQKDKRTFAKRVSDLVDDHNGLTTLYAAVVGTVGLIVAIISLLNKES